VSAVAGVDDPEVIGPVVDRRVGRAPHQVHELDGRVRAVLREEVDRVLQRGGRGGGDDRSRAVERWDDISTVDGSTMS
jgi:hypothetical protein